MSSKQSPHEPDVNDHEPAPVEHEDGHEDNHEENPEGGSSHHSGEGDEKFAINAPHPTTGLWIYTIIQFFALLLTVIGTPLEMFVLKNEWRDQIYPDLTGADKKVCITAWGIKSDCRSARYYSRDFLAAFCFRVRVNFRVIEAFTVMAIIFMAVGMVMGLLSTRQMMGKGATGAVGAFAMVLAIIPWGVVAGMYYQLPCCNTIGWNTPAKVTSCVFESPERHPGLVTVNVPRFKDSSNYGPGFGLLVAGWALQVIAIVFAFLPF